MEAQLTLGWFYCHVHAWEKLALQSTPLRILKQMLNMACLKMGRIRRHRSKRLQSTSAPLVAFPSSPSHFNVSNKSCCILRSDATRRS